MISPYTPEVSAILVAEGQVFDCDTYLSLLADRVEDMVKLEDDPKEAKMERRRQLDQADLFLPCQLSLRELVTSNSELRAPETSGGVPQTWGTGNI
jgi:hypothetical protein